MEFIFYGSIIDYITWVKHNSNWKYSIVLEFIYLVVSFGGKETNNRIFGFNGFSWFFA